jgi:hypothetical protein
LIVPKRSRATESHLVSFSCRELSGKSGMKNESKAKEKASVLTPAFR